MRAKSPEPSAKKVWSIGARTKGKTLIDAKALSRFPLKACSRKLMKEAPMAGPRRRDQKMALSIFRVNRKTVSMAIITPTATREAEVISIAI